MSLFTRVVVAFNGFAALFNLGIVLFDPHHSIANVVLIPVNALLALGFAVLAE